MAVPDEIPDDDPIAPLESYLGSAGIIRVDRGVVAQGGGHAEKAWVTLGGGVRCLAKFEGEDSPQARHEVAAWRILRLLDWDHLGSPAVYRQLRLAGDDTSAAVMPWVEDTTWKPPVNAISELDLFRAGIFDYIICNSDRQHNWLGIPQAEGTYQLWLIDHGNAFGYLGRTLNSELWGYTKSEAIPEELLADLKRFLTVAETDEALRRLLTDKQVEDVIRRAKEAVESGVVPTSRQ